MTSPGVSISPLADWWLALVILMLGDACGRGPPEPLKLWRMQHSLTQLRSSAPEFCFFLGGCLQIAFDHDFDGHLDILFVVAFLFDNVCITDRHPWMPLFFALGWVRSNGPPGAAR